MPGAARERLAIPPAGTALAPNRDVPARLVLSLSENHWKVSNLSNDKCQHIGDKYFCRFPGVAQHHSARKTRVNALLVMRRVRGTGNARPKT